VVLPCWCVLGPQHPSRMRSAPALACGEACGGTCDAVATPSVGVVERARRAWTAARTGMLSVCARLWCECSGCEAEEVGSGGGESWLPPHSTGSLDRLDWLVVVAEDRAGEGGSRSRWAELRAPEAFLGHRMLASRLTMMGCISRSNLAMVDRESLCAPLPHRRRFCMSVRAYTVVVDAVLSFSPSGGCSLVVFFGASCSGKTIASWTPLSSVALSGDGVVALLPKRAECGSWTPWCADLAAGLCTRGLDMRRKIA